MTRLQHLKDRLRARDGVPGYEKNCEALREEIARLSTPTPPAAKQEHNL